MDVIPTTFDLLIEKAASDLNGTYPAIPALQGGVKGYNIKKTPYRKALRPLGRRALKELQLDFL